MLPPVSSSRASSRERRLRPGCAGQDGRLWSRAPGSCTRGGCGRDRRPWRELQAEPSASRARHPAGTRRGAAGRVLVPREGPRVCTQPLAACCRGRLRGLPASAPTPRHSTGPVRGKWLRPVPAACRVPWPCGMPPATAGATPFLASGLARSHSTGLGSKQTGFSPCLPTAPCSAGRSSQNACSSSLCGTPVPNYWQKLAPARLVPLSRPLCAPNT